MMMVSPPWQKAVFLSVLIYLTATFHCTTRDVCVLASPVIVARDQSTGTLYTVEPDKIDQLIAEKRVFPEWVKCDDSVPDFGPPDALPVTAVRNLHHYGCPKHPDCIDSQHVASKRGKRKKPKTGTEGDATMGDSR